MNEDEMVTKVKDSIMRTIVGMKEIQLWIQKEYPDLFDKMCWDTIEIMIQRIGVQKTKGFLSEVMGKLKEDEIHSKT